MTMSKEYIEREAVITKCNKLLDNADSCPDQSILGGVKLVRDLILIDKETRVQTADVAPVVHGEWIECGKDDNDMTIVQCSNCQIKRYGTPAYCSRCGAKMDGGKK